MKNLDLKYFFKKDIYLFIKSILWLIVIVSLLFLLREDFFKLDIHLFVQDMIYLPFTTIVGFFSITLIAVSMMSLYDFIIAREFDLDLSFKDIFKIGWISNTMGNLVGESATKHGGISSILYQTEGIDSNKAGLISVIKNTLFISASAPDEEDAENGDTTFIQLNYVARAKFILALCIKSVSSFLLFFYILSTFSPAITFSIALSTFAIGLGVSVLFKIPGKMGIFELTCLYVLNAFAIPFHQSLLGLLYFRIFYYVIPWVITLLILALDAMDLKKLKVSAEQKRLIQFIGVQALASLTFFVGIVALIFTFLPTPKITFPFVHTFMPSMLSRFSLLITSGIGCFLIILSHGIYNKVKTCYYLSMAAMVLNMILMLFEGFIWIEFILFGVITVILSFSKELFYRENTSFKWHYFFKYTLLFGCLFTIYLLLLGRFLTYEALLFKGALELITFTVIIGLGGFLLTLTDTKKLHFSPPSEEELTKLEAFLNQYGGNAMSHLLFLKDKSLFYCMDRQVLIAYRPYKDKMMVLGDPMGEKTLFKEAINTFRLFADKYDMTPVFYEVSEENLPIYHENGFNFLKLGEEAIMQLSDFTLKGKKWGPIRTVRNKMLRGEFEFKLLMPPFDDPLIADLRILSDDWLDGRKEKGFSLGFFDEEYLNRAPIGIIEQNGKLLGFATIMPMYAENCFSIDLMRIVQDPPNGTMDALFIGLIEWGIEEGYESFILGKAPLSNVGLSKFSTKREKLVKHFYHYGNRFYSFKGLRYFKEKFHPDWKGVYLAYPKNTRLSITLIQLTRLIASLDPQD